MTQHALQRLHERAPHLQPDAALRHIQRQVRDGTAPLIARTDSGARIHEVRIAGTTLFPVAQDDGAIATVLVPGMIVRTERGDLRLEPTPPLCSGTHKLEAQAYHGDPAPDPSLSSTLARLLLRRSPAHAWHASPRLNPHWQPVERLHFDIGRAAHRQLLGAGADYTVIPDDLLASNGAVSTKAAKAFVEEARSEGLTPIKSDVADQIRTMAMICRGRLDAAGLSLEPERSEVAALAQIDGIWSRCMADNAPERPLGRLGPVLVDFKTTTDASPAAVERTIMTYGYDLQAAHYLATWRAATGEARAFVFVFQEKEPPHEVSVVTLSGETMEIGGRQAREARALWRTCLEEGRWPGYAAGIHEISLPEFYAARWMARESEMEDARQAASRAALRQAQEWQSPLTMTGGPA